jgi:hypothetical protein
LDKLKKYFSTIHNALNNNKVEFENEIVLQGILVDFHIVKSRTAIIITEKEHDHGESYHAEMVEIDHLKACGFQVIQLPLPDYPSPEDMAEDLFRQIRLQ